MKPTAPSWPVPPDQAFERAFAVYVYERRQLPPPLPTQYCIVRKRR